MGWWREIFFFLKRKKFKNFLVDCVMCAPAPQSQPPPHPITPSSLQPATGGWVVPGVQAAVELVTESGGRRIVQRPYGEELPRIC